MKRTGGAPPKAIPADAAITHGYQFPTEPATAKQAAALRRMMVDFMRNHFAVRFGDVSVELLAEGFGLQARRAKDVVARARGLGCSSEADFVCRVLHGMHTGEIAGVLGTPKGLDTRYFFRLVYDHQCGLSGSDLPSHSQGGWRQLPADALLDDPDGQTARIRDSAGNEIIVDVYDEYGLRWIFDPERGANLDVYRMWHAAFRVAYVSWLKGES